MHSEEGHEQKNAQNLLWWLMLSLLGEALYLEFTRRKAFLGLDLLVLCFLEHLPFSNDFQSTLKNLHHQIVDHPEGLRQHITLSIRIQLEEIFLIFLWPVLSRWWGNPQGMLPGIHRHGSPLPDAKRTTDAGITLDAEE